MSPPVFETIWLDIGIRDQVACRNARARLPSQIRFIAALETVDSPHRLATLLRLFDDPSEVLFSLDLRSGRPLAPTDAWPVDPVDLLQQVVNFGIRDVIVLDLSDVGLGQGEFDSGTLSRGSGPVSRFTDCGGWRGARSGRPRSPRRGRVPRGPGRYRHSPRPAHLAGRPDDTTDRARRDLPFRQGTSRAVR